MRWALWMVVVVVGCSAPEAPKPMLPGCESWGPAPAPTGCECGTATVVRCGYSELADCGTCASGFTCSENTCQPALDAGSSWFVKPVEGLPAVEAVAFRAERDGGALVRLSGRFVMKALSSATSCEPPTPPFSAYELTLALPDGGALSAEAVSLGTTSRLEWVSYDDAGVRTVVASARGGSVSLRRVDETATAGTLDLSLAGDPGVNARLVAWWNLATCP